MTPIERPGLVAMSENSIITTELKGLYSSIGSFFLLLFFFKVFLKIMLLP